MMHDVKTKEKNKSLKTIGIVGILFACTVIITIISLFPFPSNEKLQYTDLTNPIIYKGKIYEKEALIQEDVIYFPISFFMEHIDRTSVYDKQSKSVIITTKDKVFQFPINSLNYFLNEEPFSFQVPTIISEDNEIYVTVEPLLDLYDKEINRNTSTGIIMVRDTSDILVLGKTLPSKEHLKYLRNEPSLQSPYTSELQQGEEVIIESEKDGYYFVRQSNGIAGYVKKEVIEITYQQYVAEQKEEKIDTNRVQLPWPIQLTWEAVYSFNPDTSKLPNMPGVNIVSPTWFHIQNEKGDISNLGSLEYVNWAKEEGYQIWALFANDFQDLDMTHEVFSSYEKRQKMIRQLLQYSEMYELDGINLDIENVRLEDGPFITQFVREAVPYFHRAGLVVSMDITFISTSPTWSLFYEREELAELVDYLIVMAYDEHWGTSPVAGSVASLPWVESNLKSLLKVVPHDRLILGIPLYTRLWKEEVTENGNIQVTSRALSMDAANDWLEENELTPSYDEKTKQNYVEYVDEEEKATYKMWLEDETSLAKRVQLVHQYQLAGMATWSRVFANDSAWEVMSKNSQHIEVVSDTKGD
ncbi:glycosyl hydrolase family 18 protein [Sutcliffiella cohnii]|uniref:glycosyl hydrolase family 18 protein n=1 Tax=Sutcliffiella cohnii TaxID=33932 RepID=UPI002E218709|nr:glycosyl hydrolase family 18 protein [Sutcliffiella cohnii]MED4015220.1 glycosyl hydrolase family 18 protein [Sutcliffiella cohnii]